MTVQSRDDNDFVAGPLLRQGLLRRPAVLRSPAPRPGRLLATPSIPHAYRGLRGDRSLRSTSTRLLLRYGVTPYLLTLDGSLLLLAHFLLDAPAIVGGVFIVVTLSACYQLGLYRSRLTLLVLDDLPRLAAGVMAGGLTIFASHALLDEMANARRILTAVSVAFVVLVIARLCAFAAVRAARRRGIVEHRAVIVGAGHVGIRMATVLKQQREYGLVPVGFLDDDPRIDNIRDLPAPLLGGWRDIGRVIGEHNVSQVIVAFSQLREVELVDVLRACDRMRCEIFYVPRLFELHNVTRDVDDVRGIPLVRIRRPAFRALSWRVKRLLDVAVSSVALILLAPLLAVCAAAVRWETGPGVLFRQERVGLDGRPFEILKFRSLKPVDERESSTNWNIKDDQRLGRVGRLLRSTSLDELPQLWNILVGHMSLVGPRPERPFFVEQYAERIPRYTSRHRVPAGLTGWAQINGLRGDTSIEDRASFDNHYIENWSFWGDVKILLRTFQQVLGRRGG